MAQSHQSSALLFPYINKQQSHVRLSPVYARTINDALYVIVYHATLSFVGVDGQCIFSFIITPKNRGSHFRLPQVSYIGGIPATCSAGLSDGISAIIASVVSISDATLAAFCNAVLVTLVGSMTPASSRSS